MAFWGRSRRTRRPSSSRDAPVGTDFGPSARERLEAHVEAALALARARERRVIAAVTDSISPEIEPLEHVAAARLGDEHWTSFAQPANDGFAIATLGVAARVSASGAGRFDRIAHACGSALDSAQIDDLFDDPHAPRGSGIVWTGGFGFLDDDPYGDEWHGFPAADFVLPRAALTRRAGDQPAARITLALAVEPNSSVEQLMGQADELLERLALGAGMLTAKPLAIEGAKADIEAHSAAHFEHAVAGAAVRIKAGEFEKIVLAREVELRREGPIDAVNAVRRLRESFPDCTTFALGHGSTNFIGASPELLIRREGRRASTMALAGSMPRSDDAAADTLLGEQLLSSDKDNVEHSIVVERIERTLGRISSWVASGERPELVRVKNIQHLATPIRAQLTEPRPAIELAGMLHPTPAVGGEPWPEVAPVIHELEAFDRGWYTGGVGWMDQLEDGEFHVALRSALLHGDHARLYAGAGIVGDSNPADELAETETKLEALLPVLIDC